MENQKAILTDNDIVKKFELYRSLGESAQQKYKESLAVIERLKDEISLSKDLEKNLNDQLSQAQNRLLYFHEKYKDLILIKEKCQQNENATQNIEKKIENLQESLQKCQEKNKNAFEITSKEIELIKKNSELKAIIKQKEADYDYLKMEILATEKQKQQIVNQHEKKLSQLEDELKESKKEAAEVKNHCDKTLIIYRKQLKDYEQIIKNYEKERQSLFGEYETMNVNKEKKQARPQSSTSVIQGSPILNKAESKITWADSTMSSYVDERLTNSRLEKEAEDAENLIHSTQEEDKDDEIQVLDMELLNSFARKPKARETSNARIGDPKQIVNTSNNQSQALSKTPFLSKTQIINGKKGTKFSRPGLKQKPPLDFVGSTTDEGSINESDDKDNAVKRRRLYSNNYNHYLS